MCTAVSWKSGCHYFGRNLDLEYSYEEAVTITPRSFPLIFRMLPKLEQHHAMIGIATVADGYPLYYDAVNEKGLCIAGLNFPGFSHYQKPQTGKANLASFELIPWLLAACDSVDQAEDCLHSINITDTPFSEAWKPTPLHWIIADANRSITVEPMKDGLQIRENPVGALTNSPPFDFHLHNLRNYMHISNMQATNLFSQDLNLTPYSNGMGGIGLPGDFSSASRFVRAAFVKLHSVSKEVEEDAVNQFFHILRSVAMPRGSVKMPDGRYEITVYSCCCNADQGIYYYTTYDCPNIHCINMHLENLDSKSLTRYPLLNRPQIFLQNHP